MNILKTIYKSPSHERSIRFWIHFINQYGFPVFTKLAPNANLIGDVIRIADEVLNTTDQWEIHYEAALREYPYEVNHEPTPEDYQ
jgi:hypothetical protein